MTTNRPRATPLRAGTIAIAVALAVAVILALTGCSNDSDGPTKNRTPAADPAPPGISPDTAPEGESDLAPSGKAQATVAGKDGLIATITKIDRTVDGFMSVYAKVQNTSDEDFSASRWKGSPTDSKNMYSLAGSTVLDEKAKMDHYAILNDQGICTCTRQIAKIEAGTTESMHVDFADVSKETTEVELQLADFPRITIQVPPPATTSGE